MEPPPVIVILSAEGAAEHLASGAMACPACGGGLRKWGFGRTRTVRGLGADRVTVRPARVRCAGCSKTQVLLPTALQVRRADTTEVIGTALVHKANGLGYRRIAERLDRPESTVRRWLRRVPPEHLHWMYTQGCERLATYAADAFSRIRNTRNPLHHTLTMLAAAAFHARERFGFEDPPWTLMGMYTRGRLLAPPRGG
ncbi:helix-turn-helix domain-containing protein [Rhodococcus opacus]|uniref:helix-turn-helix domain-containing protein n=1 Tax=Rhodococcus opacus TaxID=37919 RepID=UPI001F56B698|nr:helix-turn-helix domain-containing protein [Rhodococcus opacus]UNN02041.1 helix-turn-helix domain-containing protein [Rhodococcus opacus]